MIAPAQCKIGIIVNKHLYPSIKASIDRYIADVELIEGKRVWLDSATFDETNNKKELRDSLAGRYAHDSLEGSILIGDLPLCDFLDTGTGSHDVFPCDLYYMDLDGMFAPEDLPDSHTGSKNLEIWVTRLVCSVLMHCAGLTETQILERYFDRVHLRMYGQDQQPRNYLIAGMYWEWSTLESENRQYLGYNASHITAYRSTYDSSYNDSICAYQWKMALVDGKEYAYVYSHAGGRPDRHRIGYWIHEIYDDRTNCRFYNIYCCQNARYTTANMCGAYATEDQGLISIGAAKSGSMSPGSYRAYNEPLGKGKSFGEAFKYWYTNEGLASISWHYGMTMQGVGTLRLKPYNPPANNRAPTGLSLSAGSVAENAGPGIVVGVLSSTDPDTGQEHTFRLIYGDGDEYNDSFAISGDTLFTKASFDFETQCSLSIRIRATDNGAGNLWCGKTCTLTVTNVNEAPSDISVDSLSVLEGVAGATIGNVLVEDPDVGDSHAFSVDDTRFEVSAGTLQLKQGVSLSFDTTPAVPIEITAVDQGGLKCIERCTVTVVPASLIMDTTSLATSTGVFSVGPNPVISAPGHTIVLRYTSNRPVCAVFRIFDGAGTLVRSFPVQYGKNPAVTWDLCNFRGRLAGSGMYLAVLEVSDQTGGRKMARTYIGVKNVR